MRKYHETKCLACTGTGWIELKDGKEVETKCTECPKKLTIKTYLMGSYPFLKNYKKNRKYGYI